MNVDSLEQDIEALAIALFSESPTWPFSEAAARWMMLPDEAREVWRARARRLFERIAALRTM